MRALRTRQRARTRQSGAAAVEFALMVIPLFMLLLGIIQGGFWMWAKQAGAAAALEGARVAAVSPACTNFDTFVRGRVGSAAASWSGTGRGVVRTVTAADGTTKVGDTVTVHLRFAAVGAQALIPVWPDVQETATARIENIPSTAGAC
jgi:Flp pilus assembly protein TadG